MLREQSKIITQSHKILDILLTCSAFVLSYYIKKYLLPVPFRGLLIAPNYYIILLMVIIIWYLTFDSMGLYSSYRRRQYRDIFWRMVKAVTIGMMVLLFAMYILKIIEVSRLMLIMFYFLDITFLAISKGSVYSLLQRYRTRGYNFRNILIIGSKQRAQDVIRSIDNQPEAGFKIIGCLDVDPSCAGRFVTRDLEIIGTVDNLEIILQEEVVDEVIFAMPLRKIDNADRYIDIVEKVGVSVRIIPDWQIHGLAYRPDIASVNFEDFLGIPTMALTTIPTSAGKLYVKSLMDYLFAGVALLLLFPFFIITAVAIKVFSKGPVFFTQTRSGLNGRQFKLFKFRTMVADAEKIREKITHLNETDGPVFKIKKDPRIIPYIGTFLRRSGLDELPQLINVMKGEMSLVGPRPPIPSEVEEYDRWQRRRLSMKPGLTCLWQICPDRNQVCFDDWMKMDLQYIDTWSLSLDLKILFSTVGVVFSGEGR